MTWILVNFYNIIIKEQYYPQQWLNLLETILEKGKGPLLGKLRNITLIEGDLQMMMRLHLNSEKEEFIETDSCFSKANYGSRKKYSIEIVLLEKRLILDNSLITTKPTVYTLTDLQSYYDCQLSNIGSIIEETVGRN